MVSATSQKLRKPGPSPGVSGLRGASNGLACQRPACCSQRMMLSHGLNASRQLPEARRGDGPSAGIGLAHQAERVLVEAEPDVQPVLLDALSMAAVAPARALAARAASRADRR